MKDMFKKYWWIIIILVVIIIVALLLYFKVFKNSFGKTTPCTENEISAVSEFDFSDQWINYLMMNQSIVPSDVLDCLKEHLGEYKIVKMNGQERLELTMEDFTKIKAIFKLHGYTPTILSEINNKKLSNRKLNKLIKENDKYLVDTKVYPKPEDGNKFLSFFELNEEKVLDSALGVTLKSPKEVTVTNVTRAGLTRSIVLTNTSDKKVQIESAILNDNEWSKVDGYDKNLIINWDDQENGMVLIISNPKIILEPGESTVVRYNMSGDFSKDFSFINCYSFYINDGTNRELLASVVKTNVKPSEKNNKMYKIKGTIYDEETGLPIPFIDVQTSISNGKVTTDIHGYYEIEVPGILYEQSNNYARATVLVNTISVMQSNQSIVNDDYSEDSFIVESGKDIVLNFALKRKREQYTYKITNNYDLSMQAYGFDTDSDIIAVTPFHTNYSEDYKYEKGMVRVFDKTGKLLFEKNIYGEDRTVDVSTGGKYVTAIVHSKTEADTVYVWDIRGNEVLSYKMNYKENENLIVKEYDNNPKYESSLYDAEISNDNTKLAIQSKNGHVQIIDIKTKGVIREFFMDSECSHKLLFSKDDKIIYTSSTAGTLTAIEISTGKVLWEKYIEMFIMDYILTDDSLITSTKATGTSYLISSDLKTGKTNWTLEVGMRCSKMSISKNGKTLFWGTDTGASNEGAMLINIETGSPLWGPVSGKQAGAFCNNDNYILTRSGGNLDMFTITGEHVYSANIAPDNNSMSWGVYISEDCKNIVTFAGGETNSRFKGVMYALERE